MKRRSFIKNLSHGVAIPGLAGAMGFRMPGASSIQSLLKVANEQDRVLVLIFLEGGNDGLNTVIPLDQLSNLNKARPHVILPDNSLHLLQQSEVALHPSLSDMAALYDEGRFMVVQNVGYPQQNYSHFRSTDIWMSASDSNELINSGWGGRYLSEVFAGYPEEYPTASMTDPLAVEIGYGGSLLFQGPEAAMSMVISDPSFFYPLVDNEDPDTPATPAGEKLKYIRLIERQSQEYGQVVRDASNKATNKINYPETFLGEQLKIVSRLIAGGLKTPIYMVRLGGFDTHDSQVDSSDHRTGEHASLLKEVNDAIAAFMRDTDALGTSDRILGMTFSEFGRRIVSNASLGTDHGAAAPMFFFGNHVTGGVLGKNPVIPSNAVYDDNLDWEYDFRQLYTSVLEQWFGADDSTIDHTMLRAFDTPQVIGASRLLGLNKSIPDRGINIYPNPVPNEAIIEIPESNGTVEITVMDLTGRVVDRPNINISGQKLYWNAAGLRSGRYLVVARSSSWQKAFPIYKL